MTNRRVETDEERFGRYNAYLLQYEGQQWGTRPREDEKRLTVNYLRVLVNKAGSYLMSVPPKYQVTAARDLASAPANVRDVEHYLEMVAAFNRLAGVDLDAAISAGVMGDGAFTVRWDAAAGLPRVTWVDPGQLVCAWRTDDMHTLLRLRQKYITTADQLPTAWLRSAGGDPILGTDRVEVTERWTPRAWAVEVGGMPVASGPNPYGRIPYVVFPNLRVPGQFWGQSDIVDILGLQEDLNQRFSTLSLILELSGAPITVVENVTESQNLRFGPGQVWDLPEKAKAYLLDLLSAGGAQLHVEYLNLLYRALHDLAEMPRTSFGDSSGQGARSGVALEIELQPLLHKIARKRLTWSVALVERAELVLRVAEAHGLRLSLPASELRIGVDWPPVLPQDRQKLADVEATLVTHQIHSRQRAMQVMGEDDAAAEWARVLAEEAALASQQAAPVAGSGARG